MHAFYRKSGNDVFLFFPGGKKDIWKGVLSDVFCDTASWGKRGMAVCHNCRQMLLGALHLFCVGASVFVFVYFTQEKKKCAAFLPGCDLESGDAGCAYGAV